MSTRESRKGPEEVILELGGCGRFQIRMALLIHLMNIVVAWSLYAMVFVTATPKWWCRDVDLNSDLSYYNLSTFANTTYEKVCVAENGTPCSNFEFRTSDMRTIVTEVILVCLPSLFSLVTINIGIKHDFLCINVCWTPREVLKPGPERRVFQHFPRGPADVNVSEKRI